MRLTVTTLVCIALLLSGCTTTKPETVSAIGLSSPTPFQPGQETAPDSLYADSAPTPLSLPTVSPLNSAPTEIPLTPTATVPPTPTVPPVINPLTGLPQADPSRMDRRPMAIKIANYPRYIRPQSGLSLADQVFEYYIEDGLTRNIAIFYGNDSEWVGPVRSGRFFDENIARMYQSFLVFKFADKRVLEYFKTTDIAQFLVVPSFGNCPPFKGMDERKIEVYNNQYFNTILWADCVTKNNLPNDKPYLSGLFSADPPTASSVSGTDVYTYFSEYSYNHWAYDSGTQQYLRFQETDDMINNKEEKYAPLIDNVTGQQVHAANIVVIFTYHTFSNPFDEDDEVYHIDLTGGGEAYVFRDGVGIPAKWSRLMPNQPLLLTTTYGEQIALRPGITYYEVIGKNSYASQGDGEWFFHHATP
ncbi:MAG: DUF3048 domain-containing protein [Anaerolineales bacterium]|nr:DUF3048 domain-containing protein [Anaerolineales bacterium]